MVSEWLFRANLSGSSCWGIRISSNNRTVIVFAAWKRANFCYKLHHQTEDKGRDRNKYTIFHTSVSTLHHLMMRQLLFRWKNWILYYLMWKRIIVMMSNLCNSNVKGRSIYSNYRGSQIIKVWVEVVINSTFKGY